ncbi:MAG: hypothetical protein Q4F00_10025 [bacterium]|nr:hypothetical protein [bacterium]
MYNARYFSKVFISAGILVLTGTLLLSAPSESMASPASPALQISADASAGWLAAAPQNKFVLRDPRCQNYVESYTLKPGWQGFGEVNLRADPTGANMVTWYSGFSSSSGAKAYVDSTYLLTYNTPFAKTPLAVNNQALTKMMLSNLTRRAHVKSMKAEYVKLTGCQDPQVLKIAKEFISYQKQMNPACRGFVKEAIGEFSFSKNGQPWKAKCRIPMVVTESPMIGMPSVCATYVALASTYSYIYPAASAEQCLADASFIVKSRTPNPQWERELNGLRTNVSNSSAQENLKRAQIWQNNQNAYSNMRADSQRRRDASERRLSQKRSDATLGTTTVSDPFHSGRTITTQNKHEHVWVNSRGDQIGSGNANYNPNSDKRYNNTEWRQVR